MSETGTRPTAVITGASSGIGAATARRLAAEGFAVVLLARRKELLARVAEEIGDAGGEARAHAVDVTDADSVAALAAAVERCDVLVNVAGGAFGVDEVSEADPADWLRMYEVNVLGTLRLAQALLPRLLGGRAGTVVVLTSTASFTCYEGGGGYSAAKHAAHALARTLRLEVCGTPLRVVEIAPGMVRTEEFALNRYRGDATRAAEVYAGVPDPLLAEDVADTVAWAVTRPPHVNVDLLVVRPRAQAAQHKVHRTD
ncbi:SDR family NAD(P)-dependent oxidoreductase [Streptomyces profundus]|uniref:SDR family NAD(P)-dependent oxidoreductase n=1 Tax=Streptomyces profundus TaxID=2867410 RepID=UPI001D1693CC|nr:SDR family oxidoreductase [Streptomyces sp. MA3_2.13]UED87561.1 SDR family oxidoreductase [Streptomyces sp. MA3_2.13]